MAQFKGTTHKLTKDFVEGLPLAERDEQGRVKQRLYWDSRDRGFGILVGLNRKTFVVQRQIAGRTVRESVGKFGPSDWTVEQARKEARQRLSALARGERQSKAPAITLKDAWERVALPYLHNKKRSPTTVRVYGYNLDKYLSDWMNRPLAQIGRTEARERHEKLAADPGKHTADLVMKVFGTVYNRALAEHDLPVNPTVAVAFHEPEPPRSAIPREKLAAWSTAVGALTNAVQRDCLLFLLYSGLRKSSAMSLRWQDVDLDRKVAHIATTKGDKPFDLPMNSQMVEIVKRRQKERALYAAEPKCEPWVFPAAASASGHVIVLPQPEVDDLAWVIHDLRRVFITTAEGVGISPYAIKCLVNHAQPRSDVTAGYLTLTTARLGPDMQKIGDAIAAAIENRAAKVVAIGKARAKA